MFLDFFLPNRCLKCNLIIPSEEIVCWACKSHINFTYNDFGGKGSFYQKVILKFPVNKAFSLMKYEKKELSQDIIHSLKYHSIERVGKVLAHWVSENIDLSYQGIDILTSIPLHSKKQRERGYNQLHLFTKTLSQLQGIFYSHHLLKRNFYSKPQALKQKLDREKIQNMFSVDEKVEGKHILLIDDVYTTGNTMSKAVWELLKGRDNQISILVLSLDD
ncbi:phosphoribosyltransferase family protein [Riemerella anatipestifer]|uniref:ComF family protein n=1 Tax=Riemerella anatipestifer TaxID=34085 RepID=UPI002855AC3E|nr:phosphoribosyltransferase family protein [Riemerella anatipestifer]MDR7779340.1 phosphoribosyltransferase family protein [Riemerella anatipestifer]